MTVSLCVPVHDPESKLQPFLVELLTSVLKQDVLPAEVVITANHDLSYQSDLSALVGSAFAFRVIRSMANNAPSNLNFAVSQCRGDFVRILFQDDLLPTASSLSSSVQVLMDGKAQWAVCAFDHLQDESGKIVRPMVPRIGWRLRFGVNRVGAPSVVTFRRSAFVQADESLVFLFDCDWYLRMLHANGKPATVARLGCRVRLHAGQATEWAKVHLPRERKWVFARHNIAPRALPNSNCKCIG